MDSPYEFAGNQEQRSRFFPTATASHEEVVSGSSLWQLDPPHARTGHRTCAPTAPHVRTDGNARWAQPDDTRCASRPHAADLTRNRPGFLPDICFCEEECFCGEEARSVPDGTRRGGVVRKDRKGRDHMIPVRCETMAQSVHSENGQNERTHQPTAVPRPRMRPLPSRPSPAPKRSPGQSPGPGDLCTSPSALDGEVFL